MSDTEYSENERDSVFTDAASGTGTDTASRAKRQLSVSEMARNLERKRPKNSKTKKAGGAKSPQSRAEADTGGVNVTLEAIKDLIEKGNHHVIEALERKFEEGKMFQMFFQDPKVAEKLLIRNLSNIC